MMSPCCFLHIFLRMGNALSCRGGSKRRRETIHLDHVAQENNAESVSMKAQTVTKVNQYKIEDKLGSGSFGVVFQAGACMQWARCRLGGVCPQVAGRGQLALRTLPSSPL